MRVWSGYPWALVGWLAVDAFQQDPVKSITGVAVITLLSVLLGRLSRT